MRLRSSWVMRIRLKPRWVRMLRVHSSVLLRYSSRVTTSDDEGGILLWYTATSCCLFYRMISYNFVWFFSTFTHVLACVFTVSAMASPLLGSVGEFDPASETFTAYFERLEQFFMANDNYRPMSCWCYCGCCSRSQQEKGCRNDLRNRKENLWHSSWFVQSREPERENFWGHNWITAATFQAQAIGCRGILQVSPMFSGRKWKRVKLQRSFETSGFDL